VSFSLTTHNLYLAVATYTPMDSKALLKPTLHIEVMLREKAESAVSDYTVRLSLIT